MPIPIEMSNKPSKFNERTGHKCHFHSRFLLHRRKATVYADVTVFKALQDAVGFAESPQRFQKMTERGEDWRVPVRSESGNLVLSSIANFTEDDVWEVIGEVMNGLISTYSDFTDLYNLYREGGGGGCVITFSEISKTNGEANKKAGGCGARFGCAVCTRVKNDKSLMSMIELEPEKYGYMRGVNALREYLINTRWDFNRRMWVGRSITSGWIAIQPDSYSPEFCLELLRICLTLDAREIVAAGKLGLRSRFTLVPLKALVMIDSIWSMQGYHKPFQAMKVWDEVMNQGLRFEIPQTQTFLRKAMPETRYFHVGKDWDDGEFYGAGLHCSVTDIYSESGWNNGCMGHSTLLPKSKDETLYFFSTKYDNMAELPDGAVVGLPSLEDVIQVENDYPNLKCKQARGKSTKVLQDLSDGIYDAVMIPSKKLSKRQMATAQQIGDASIDDGNTISVLNVETSDELDVDNEGASLAMNFEFEDMLKKNAAASDSFGLTAGYRWWLQMGIISVNEKQLRKIDSVLRRTSFKERNGLAGANYKLDDVLSRSVSKAEFYKLSVKKPPTEAERLQEWENKTNAIRENLRWKLRQDRIALKDLYLEWAPDVDWKRLMTRKELKSSRIPRKHTRNKMLVLRHFVSRVELAKFIAENESVRRSVQAYRPTFMAKKNGRQRTCFKTNITTKNNALENQFTAVDLFNSEVNYSHINIRNAQQLSLF